MRTVLLPLFLAAFAHAAAPPWPAKSRWPVGRSVTFVDGPLDEDGYIDYPAALNARLKHGVTAENNAAVLLWRVSGPRVEGGTPMPAYFARLGIDAPPEKGDNLLSRERFARERLNLESAETLQAVNEEVAAAQQRPWKEKDRPRVAAWLQANEKPLAVAVEATRRPRYYSPVVPTGRGGKSHGLLLAPSPVVRPVREVAEALIARAMWRVAKGDAAEAWADLLASHRLARLVAQGGTLTEFLVGIAIETQTCSADLAFLAHSRPGAKELAGYDRDLRGLPPMPRTADKVDQSERLVYLDMVQLIARHGPRHLQAAGGGPVAPDSPFIRLFEAKVDFTPAMRFANEWFDRLAAAMRVPTRSERAEQMTAFERQVKLLHVSLNEPRAKLAAMFGGPEVRGREVGKVLVWLYMPVPLRVHRAEDRIGQTLDNLLVAIALERHHRDHGSYPSGLAALSPKYLKVVPEDRFRPGPLTYLPGGKGYLLYSIGVNGRDDEGKSYSDAPLTDDLVVRVPPRKPKG